MSVSGVIRGVIATKEINAGEVAAQLGQSKQAFANKLQRGSFSVDDLIRLAAVIGCRVALLSDDGKTFVFNESDAAPPRRSGFASKAPADQAAE